LGNFEPGDLWVIDAAADTIITTMELGLRVEDLAVHQGDGRVYVSTPEENSVRVVDGISLALTADIPVGSKAVAIGIDETNDLVYAAAPDEDKVLVIDGLENELIDEIPVGRGPREICLLPSIDRIYVLNGRGEDISVIDGVSLEVVEEVRVAENMVGLAAWKEEMLIYVCSPNHGSIFVLSAGGTPVDAGWSSEPVPIASQLGQNFPNPFNAATRIPITLLPGDLAEASLRIYNIAGQLVRQLTLPALDEGRGMVLWDGLDDSGRRVASGLYLSRLQVGGFHQTGKMVLLR
jgi:hypothetical protein